MIFEEERSFVDFSFFKCRKAFSIYLISASEERCFVDIYFSSEERRFVDIYFSSHSGFFQVRVKANWCHVEKSAERAMLKRWWKRITRF